MAWLNHAAADFQLFTLDERSEELTPVDFRDTGNLDSRLVHAFSQPMPPSNAAAPGLDRLLALVPAARASRALRSGQARRREVGLLLHGLEFARVRQMAAGRIRLPREDEVTFGAGANETPLTEENEPLCRELFARLFREPPSGRHAHAIRCFACSRSAGWSRASARRSRKLLPGLRGEPVYCAGAGAVQRRSRHAGSADARPQRAADGDRAESRRGPAPAPAGARLLDSRARAQCGPASLGPRRPTVSAFERQGYFPGAEVSPLPPRLLLVAPALRIHPANEPVLRYLSPQVEWELMAVSEHWRRELKVVFRARCSDTKQ